jgi:hypothetical protein
MHLKVNKWRTVNHVFVMICPPLTVLEKLGARTMWDPWDSRGCFTSWLSCIFTRLCTYDRDTFIGRPMDLYHFWPDLSGWTLPLIQIKIAVWNFSLQFLDKIIIKILWVIIMIRRSSHWSTNCFFYSLIFLGTDSETMQGKTLEFYCSSCDTSQPVVVAHCR